MSWPQPAYVVRTERLVIRCYERGDVDAVHAGIVSNKDALLPWMSWFQNEPMTREERAAQLRRFRGSFDVGKDFFYGLFSKDDGAFLGGTGLHPRGGGGVLEIGYWIVPARWGQGLAFEVAAALTRVGFEVMEARRIEIRVAPHNARSVAIPRKLGYREEGLIRGVGENADGSFGDLVLFGMLQAELPDSCAAKAHLEIERFSVPD
ncbi:MAG: GNAT family protein [Sandaracinaceae bacterium]